MTNHFFKMMVTLTLVTEIMAAPVGTWHCTGLPSRPIYDLDGRSTGIVARRISKCEYIINYTYL